MSNNSEYSDSDSNSDTNEEILDTDNNKIPVLMKMNAILLKNWLKIYLKMTTVEK